MDMQNLLSKNQVVWMEVDEVIEFEQCIISVGSRVTKFPMFPFEDKTSYGLD